jgi:tRNA-dihydrouridine synthase B
MPLPPPPKIGSLQLSSPLILAPMSGRTDVAFRIGVRRIGGLGLAFTDLTNPHGVLRGNLRTSQILASCEEDRPLGIQIYGAEAELMAKAACHLEEQFAPAVIDINMGCPVFKITRKGGGSALMAVPEQAGLIAAAVVEAVEVPVTAKLRLGTDAAHVNAPEVARRLAGVGVSALTVHGRTAEQRYSGAVNFEAIRVVVEAVPDIPVFANGNIVDHETAVRALAVTGAAGLAIGRGAMYNPWIFSQITALDRGETPPEPSRAEAISFMRLHFRRLMEVRGSYRGCRQFRKWVSHYGSALKMSRTQRDLFMRITQPDELEGLADELDAEE